MSRGGQQFRMMIAADKAVREAYKPRDLEPVATRLWRDADTLSLCEPYELAGHVTAIREAIEKLQASLDMVENDQ